MKAKFVDALWGDLLRAMQCIDNEWDITNDENELCRRIAGKLNQLGDGLLEVTNHRKYRKRDPLENRLYDLRIAYPSGEIVYLEAKGHWPSYWLKRDGRVDTYRKHLSGDANESSTIDLLKLAQATPNHATHVALLLVGSYAVPPDEFSYTALPNEFDEFATSMAINTLPWEFRERRNWPNPHADWLNYRRDVRLFACPFSELPIWFGGVSSRLCPSRMGRIGPA